MAHFDIISSQGQHPVIWSGAPKYVGAYLKPGYLEFPAIGSPTPLSWHVGDYVVYSRTGKTYRLYRTQQAVEQGLSNKYGASFLYENVQFFDDSKQLEFCPFTDLVPGDNTVHFSTQNVVSFFGKPANVAERIQACLEAQYGAGTWEVRVVTTSDADLLEILNTEIEFSVTGANCQEVLDKVYEQWNGLGWIHTVENGKNVITIGASNVRTNANTTMPFAFDNGLVRVERSIANADQIGTRLFAYGSMKNMDATYYRGLDIKDAESVDIEHLMIPIANWGITDGKPDARKAYIENATAIASLGLIPKTAYFDGSGDLPDIHPTIERMTIGEVYDAGGAGYVPDLSKWSRSDRIDELVSAVNPSDHGTSADQGQKYIETLTGNVAAVTRGFFPDEEVSIGIYYATVVHAGNASLRFGQNSQALQIIGSWTPAFNLSILISAGNIKKEIPIVPAQVSSSEWSFILPESVSFGKVSAGATISVSIVGFVSGSASSSDAVALVTDSGTSAETSVEHEIDKTFTVRIPQLGFDIEKYAELGNGKILSMKTGMCGARDFEIKDVRYVASADAWDLTLYRSVDEGLNIMFPNADYQIASGDQFVLLDIAMPEMYVTVASSRLLAAAQKLLADISSEKPFYNPQVDAKVVYNEGRILREGMWMDITQEGNHAYCLIDSITIDENGSNIPTYEVALREKKGIDWTENVGKYGSSKSSVSVKGGEEVKTNGTVTSVGMTAPTGLEVEGSPITGTGVLKLKLASGYKIPLESELAPYFEQDDQIATLVKLKAAYSYLGPKKGLIFDSTPEADVASSPAHLMLRNLGTQSEPNYALYTPFALITGGDQIVGSGTPGGGGGGASNLYQLDDVFASGTDVLRADGTPQEPGDALVYNTAHGWVASPVQGGGGGTYLAGFALRLDAGTTFGINTGSDTGTDVDFDTDHPGITPEDTVTWGSAIGDYGVNLIIDTGTAVTKGLTLATAHAALATRVTALENAPAYSLPLAQSGVRGGIQIGYTQNGKNYPVQLSSEKAYVNVPWTDTTYDPGTTTLLNTGTDTDNRVWSAKALADWLSGKSYLTSAVTSLGGASGAITLGTGLEIVSGELRVTGQTSGTVTQVNVGSTPYTPTDGVVTLPNYGFGTEGTGTLGIIFGSTTKTVLTAHQSLSGYVNALERTPSTGGNYVKSVTKSGSTITVTYDTLPTATSYSAGLGLKLTSGVSSDVFALNTDSGTDVTFDTDHPGITPEDTVTWGAAIGDYGINLTVDTGTAVTKGLALASALNSLRTTVSGLVTGVSSVAGKAGDVSLVIADISGLQTALDGKQPSGNYLTTAVTSLGAKTGAITLGSGLSIDNNNVLTATGTTYTPGTTSDLNTGTSTTTMVWAPSVLASWLSGKNYITNSVNNLTNYYKKTETYTQTEVNNLIGGISGFSYVIAPSTSSVTDPSSHVLYLIGPTGSGADKYEEYVYPDATTGWTKIGDTSIDLSGYVNTLATSGSGNYVASLSKSGNTITATYGTLPTYSVFTDSSNGLVPMSSNANKTTAESSVGNYYLCADKKFRQLPANAFSDHTYDAGLGLKLTSGTFALNTDTGTDVDFDTDHPGITPEDTVTWGTAIGDYGINLTIDTGTASTKGLALASALANLRTVVDGKQPAGDYLTSVPAATSSVVGGFLLGYEQSGRNYPVQLSSNKAYVYVPWVSYSNATTDTAGLMSPADKAKLDGVASGATAVNDATVSGWGYVKSSGITSVTQGQSTSGGAVTTSGSSVTIQFPTLPTASSTVLGGIILGSGLTYNSTTGKVDVTGQTSGTVTGIVLGSGNPYEPTNGIVTLPAYPTTLPASDVYSWAKASTKPSYSLPEITGTTDLQLIEALTGPSSGQAFLKRKSDNTWALDTNTYLTSVAFADLTTHPTTIAGYGITDAKIANGVITLGSATITPLTSHQTIYALTIYNSASGSVLSWTPNSAAGSLTLTKAMVGLSNVPNFTWTYESDVTYTT